MTANRLASMAALDRAIDWFIPAELAAERETRQRARMFLISHLIGPFIGNVVPLALWILDPKPGYDVIVLAVSITAFWIFPFVLRATGRYNLLSFLSIENLIFCILWSCYFNGGVQSPTLPWVLTIPLLTFFYLGPASSLRPLVVAFYAGNFAVFFALCIHGLPAPTAPFGSLQGLGMVSTLAAACYVAMMAIYYAKILASGVELEAEMKGHLATAQALRTATAEAERAGAAKGEFLAKMSHELRTPLNAVIGYSQMLLEDAEEEGDEASCADLRRIHGAGHHLLHLVNDVLDLSKIEAGKMEVVVEQVDLDTLIHDAVQTHAGEAAKTGNTVRTNIPERVGTIVADAAKIRQVLDHVLENAVRFTKDGEVTVSAARHVEAGIEEVAVRIADTGIGIAPEVIGVLFENFSVADDTSTSKYGGTGLGLALSWKLCALMGGRISVESELGRGSCFTVTLPVAPADFAAASLEETGRPALPEAQPEPSADYLLVA